MSTLFHDLRYALRQLRKSPGFTLTAILTLALGIGANTAVFAIFDQVLLRMLPVRNPRELVRFEWHGAYSGSFSSFGGDYHNYFSYPMYKDLRDRNQVFQGVAAADRDSVGLSWRNQAESADAEIVSGNYFQLLGLKPALGRLLTPADDTAKNANPVLVLSYAYWKSHLASSDVAGQTILLNGHTFTILGVAPENFQSAIGGHQPAVFVPLSMSEIAMPWTASRDNFNNRQSIWLTLFARLKPGIAISHAQASLSPLWRSLRAQELQFYRSASPHFTEGFVNGSALKVIDDSQGFSPDRTTLETPLAVLMSMAGLFAAMCAINVAALLLLRAAVRAREMSMRYALGARRGRIVAQLLVEGGLLGLAGGAAGLALAPAVAKVLMRINSAADPGAEPYLAAINSHVLLFTLGLALVVCLLFSVAPVIHFFKPDLVGALRQNAATATKGSQRFRKLTVGVQIALSVILLGVAGLFVRTFENLRHQPVGYEISHLIAFGVHPANSGYGQDRIVQVMAGVLETVRRLPGVQQAAGTTDPELSGDSWMSGFSVQGHPPGENEDRNFEQPWITPGYFATLRQPLLAGRDFTSSDRQGAPQVAIVNAAFARRFFSTPQDALGILVGEGNKPDTVIVGVVGDVRHRDLRTDLGPAVYRPYLQEAHPGGLGIYARTVQPPETVELAVREAIHQLDPLLVVDGLRTMEDQVDRSASQERSLAILAASFSVLALLLAAVGLYGVLAYSTAQRTSEIGVRLALGAKRWSIVALVVREMALIAAIATIVALPSVIALAQLFRSQLYGVAGFDPLALASALALTAIMVLLAAALPAHRAASIDPMQALRTE